MPTNSIRRQVGRSTVSGFVQYLVALVVHEANRKTSQQELALGHRENGQNAVDQFRFLRMPEIIQTQFTSCRSALSYESESQGGGG
jgi:hypothetical protein